MLGIFSISKYKYISKAIFQYVPTTIIDQTILNITSDVNFYQSKSPCNQSSIMVSNLLHSAEYKVWPKNSDSTKKIEYYPYDSSKIISFFYQLYKHVIALYP